MLNLKANSILDALDYQVKARIKAKSISHQVLMQLDSMGNIYSFSEEWCNGIMYLFNPATNLIVQTQTL